LERTANGSLDFGGTANGNAEDSPNLDGTEDSIPYLCSGYCCSRLELNRACFILFIVPIIQSE
jgi:hypothetical protein